MAWCKLQLEYAANQLTPTKALPRTTTDITTASEGYWGPKCCNENTFGNIDKHSFTVDKETTHKILGVANNAFETQPVEVMLAALLHAFTIVFADRSTPTIFTEGHGREPWDNGINLTRTVGWFTSMYPITVSLQSKQTLIEVLRRTKDARRQVPANGWAYFTSRYLNPQGRQTFAQRGPMEVLFNYLGLYQQFEGPNAFLKWDQSLPTAADVTDEMPRFALIDVSSYVIDNCLHFWFYMNRHMNHLEALDQWVEQCEISLREAAAILPTLDPAYTLSDFPLSSLTYEKFDEFLRCNQLRYGDLEDIYPCSPLQEGILVSQAKNPDQYWTRYIWDVVTEKTQQGIDTDRLARAWQQVVNRHATLRTVFASLSADAFVDQVVLRHVTAAVRTETRTENSPSESGTSLGRTTLGRTQPPNELLIWRIGEDRVQCKLLINHALIDAASIQILKRDFILAYDRELSTEQAPPYREYIAYLQGKDLEPD
ncbi:Condensation domain protein [Aspergillus sclerotialis]|uniref:Condensation domain protein n=1 Tax=Aspergillus sclerotialis TaxID=2070753 RepID=A0A3A3A4V6_9EURO|nr:Condensation domain protein [Aspergillus sclerotialis]